MYLTKEIIVTRNVIKTFCTQARNMLTNLSPSPAYNSEPARVACTRICGAGTAEICVRVELIGAIKWGTHPTTFSNNGVIKSMSPTFSL